MVAENILARAQDWLAQDPDPDTRAELEALIRTAPEELAERFSGRLEFGTAGIRGVVGAGPMRMNRMVVRQVSAGLADYVLAYVQDAKRRGIVIGYDGRPSSRQFAEDAARVFVGKGLHVHLFRDLVPTPLTAFAVRACNAAAGVMVTASHNPPEYNGYKVYWENGAQIIPPLDAGIADAIGQVGRMDTLALPDLDAAYAGGMITPVAPEVERAYLDGIRALALHPMADAAAEANITIAYTPLHGVGARLGLAALNQAGFTRVHVEPSQAEPDGTFPTVRFPNPEEKGAMDRVIALARSVHADLVLANDPDADRLAVAVPEGEGYRMLTGDQIGVLLADYLLSEGPQDSRLVATTVVSSQLLGVMAKERGVSFLETLTGFKWIANAALRYQAAHPCRFVMGYEEALGYTCGELVRDKDGISAAVIMAEMAAWDKQHGKTLWDRLKAIYDRYGLFLTEQVSLTLPGSEGIAEINALMQSFRREVPASLGNRPVARYLDLEKGLEQGDQGLPPSDVLMLFVEGGHRVVMRPSGTEPKLKCYYEVREPVGAGESIDTAVERARTLLAALRDGHQAELARRRIALPASGA